MSPQAGCLLVEEIAPRLRSIIPKAVKPVGAEDSEELLQDAITFAAQILDSVEKRKKKVTVGNIAYYVTLHMKSGRRSQCASRADTMAGGTQLDGKSSVMSVEEEVAYDPETNEAITLGSLLTTDQEDPSTIATRQIDWSLFLATHDYRYGVIVLGYIQGKTLKETARDVGVGYSGLWALKQQLAIDLLEFLGPEAVTDSLKAPTWKGNMTVDRERASCQADRRRW